MTLFDNLAVRGLETPRDTQCDNDKMSQSPRVIDGEE
jgi:hypothetical protein